MKPRAFSLPEAKLAADATSRSLLDASRGRALDAATQRYFEARFAHDFSRICVHADGFAAESARREGVDAFTAGPHIVFAPGAYQPGTPVGRTLLAHELAHAVQQEGGQHPEAGGHAAEVEATVAGQFAAAGFAVRPSLRSAPGIQRQTHPSASEPAVAADVPTVRAELWRRLFRRQQGVINGADVGSAAHARQVGERWMHRIPELMGGASLPPESMWDEPRRLAQAATPHLDALLRAQDMPTVLSAARLAESALLQAGAAYRRASAQWSAYMAGTMTGAERAAIGVGVGAAIGIAVAAWYAAPIVAPALAELSGAATTTMIRTAPNVMARVLANPGLVTGATETAAGAATAGAEGGASAALAQAGAELLPRVAVPAGAALLRPTARYASERIRGMRFRLPQFGRSSEGPPGPVFGEAGGAPLSAAGLPTTHEIVPPPPPPPVRLPIGGEPPGPGPREGPYRFRPRPIPVSPAMAEAVGVGEAAERAAASYAYPRLWRERGARMYNAALPLALSAAPQDRRWLVENFMAQIFRNQVPRGGWTAHPVRGTRGEAIWHGNPRPPSGDRPSLVVAADGAVYTGDVGATGAFRLVSGSGPDATYEVDLSRLEMLAGGRPPSGGPP